MGAAIIFLTHKNMTSHTQKHDVNMLTVIDRNKNKGENSLNQRVLSLPKSNIVVSHFLKLI